ncbi:hypothetical protein CQ018_02760 [Arthrobacter sp. MYb227]|uniref:hypothetical protein n=1 Tax=Arthrobacter sp. MYb227 TaxID=1848601 RepID=UPI000CFC3BFA|nr:hypothetical protein [Arthrobacter sp. MYb227]PQZ96215.1 hypothetical protein CQ018_02760 [Arthrobacter sp. MYb227]
MSDQEKIAWTTLLAGIAGMVSFVGVVLLHVLSEQPVGEANYSIAMVGCLLLMAIPVFVVQTVLHFRDEYNAQGADERDRDIARRADQIKFQILSFACVIVLSLVFTGAAYFWIATVMASGFILALLSGAWTQISGYRRGLAA